MNRNCLSSATSITILSLVFFLLLFSISKPINAKDPPENGYNLNITFLPVDIVDVYFPFGKLYRIPENSKISDFLTKADRYKLSGDFRQAYKYYSYAFQRVKNTPAAPYILFKRAYTVSEERIFIKELKNILSEYPNFPLKTAVSFELSLFLYLNNLYKEANYYVTSIVENNESHFYPYALTLKGYICLNEKNYEEAIHYFFKSIASMREILSCKEYEMQLMNNYLGLAICYYRNSDFKTSEVILKKIYGTSNIAVVREKALFYLYKIFKESNRKELAILCLKNFKNNYPESLYFLEIKNENNNLGKIPGQEISLNNEKLGKKDESMLYGIDSLDELIKINEKTSSQFKQDTEYSIKSGFYVQVGSFKYEKNAETVAEKIREYKYQVNIYKGNSGDEIYYRVRVGPFDTKEDALNVLNKLRKNKFQGYVVRKK